MDRWRKPKRVPLGITRRKGVPTVTVVCQSCRAVVEKYRLQPHGTARNDGDLFAPIRLGSVIAVEAREYVELGDQGESQGELLPLEDAGPLRLTCPNCGLWGLEVSRRTLWDRLVSEGVSVTLEA
jgi:hypothetical protein